MAKPKNLLGYGTCPECQFDEAEVKTTKAGFSYRWCPECNAQYFPRCKATSDRLLDKMHTTATADEQAPAPALAPAPVTEAVPVPVPEKAKTPGRGPGPFDFLLKKETA